MLTTKRRLGKRLHAWIPANRADWSHSEKMEPKKLASPAPAFVLVGLVPKCPSVLMASGGDGEGNAGIAATVRRTAATTATTRRRSVYFHI